MQSSKRLGMFSWPGVRTLHPYLPFYINTHHYTLYLAGQAPEPNSQDTRPHTPRASHKPTITPIPIPIRTRTRTPVRDLPIPARDPDSDPLEIPPAAAAVPDIPATATATGMDMHMDMHQTHPRRHPRPHAPGRGRDPALAKASGTVSVRARMTGP